MRAQGPDGATFEFPDDTPEDVIGRTIASHYAAQESPASDVAKSAVGGFERGVAGLAGLAGSAREAADTVGDVIVQKGLGSLYNRFAPGGTGRLEPKTDISMPRGGPLGLAAAAAEKIAPNLGLGQAINPTLPTSGQTVGAYEAVRGPTYQPQTKLGQYASTVGEFAGGNALLPGGLLPKAVGAVAGGIGSEAAGQYAQNTGAPPEAQVAARVAGGLLAPAAVGRVITPIRADPSRAGAIARLEQEGVTDLSAGQRVGSPTLRRAETTLAEVPFGAPSVPQQAEQFNRAVSRYAGADEAALTPAVINEQRAALQQQYKDIHSRNVMQVDLPLTQDIAGTLEKYNNRISSTVKPDFEANIKSLISDIQRNGGQLPGELYQQARSHFAEVARDARGKDSAYAAANKDLQKALDSAMERSMVAQGNDADVAALRDTNRHWRGLDTIETALGNVQKGTPEGFVTPQALFNAARQKAGKGGVARGQDDLLELAKAARSLDINPPNSGTAARSGILNLASGGGAAGSLYGVMSGAASPLTALGGVAASLGAPALASNVLNRSLGQGYFGNQLLPRGVLSGARALVNAQAAAAAAPSGILGLRDERQRRLPRP